MAQGWVIVAEGEGATAQIVNGDLHEGVHKFMCLCGKPWQECLDAGIKNDVRQLNDDHEWTRDEDGDNFSIHWKHETGRISLFALHGDPA